MHYLLKGLNERSKPFANQAIICSLLLGLGFIAAKNADAQPTYNRFADYCLNYDRLPEATKVTVRVLADQSMNGENWDTIIGTDKCYQAEQGLLNIQDRKLHATVSLGTISDLTPLTTIDKNINDIYLPGHEIQDLRPLAAFPNLETLNLEKNLISDLTGLSSLNNLKELNLQHNLISDLSPLSSLTNLAKLNLYYQASAESYWQGVEAGVKGDNTNLPRFDDFISQDRSLEGNLSDISPLASMSGLREVYLGTNKISDVSPLASLTRLEMLYLDDNEITDVSSLGTMSSLVNLDLRRNYIPPEKRVCPIDVESVCDFSEQETAVNSSEDTVNTERTTQPQLNQNSSVSQPQPQNPSSNSPDNSQESNPIESENRPTQQGNDTRNRVEEEVRETIRDAPEKVFDSLF